MLTFSCKKCLIRILNTGWCLLLFVRHIRIMAVSPTSTMNSEGPNKCTWRLNADKDAVSPHLHVPFNPAPKKILSSIVEQIGNTPMVRLERLARTEGLQCELLAKCEFLNAGGSVKDRIGRRMIEDAEKQGRIKPGDTLIEPTSGNTGIGLALCAVLKGYRMIITLPEKMSQEKVDVLKALGAEIVRTPTEAAWDSEDSHLGVAKRLNMEIPNSHILDQYANPSNPLAHYDGTAEEILYQCDGKIDAVVVAAGTGGTITGIARKLKERLPNVKIFGVDPHGSILARPESLNGKIEPYEVEGIGYDFIPTVLDRPLIDEWIKSNDKESFIMARRLICEEGLLVGGSSGSAVWGAIQVARRFKKGERVVVLLPDSVRNYMSKFLNTSWMEERGYIQPDPKHLPQTSWSSRSVADLRLETPVTVHPELTCHKCIEILNQNGFDQLPCVDTDGSIIGVVALGNIVSQITSARIKSSDPISKALYRQFRKVTQSTTLGELSRIFDRDPFAIVMSTQKQYQADNKVVEKSVVSGVVTRIDLLNFLLTNSAN